jgi:hypothetical protein
MRPAPERTADEWLNGLPEEFTMTKVMTIAGTRPEPQVMKEHLV